MYCVQLTEIARAALTCSIYKQFIHYTILKSTCDVNLLSKLSIIFKEWRVIVLFIGEIQLCIGECPSNSPFHKNNGAEAHCF
jgi:hypothetical protein